MISYAEIEVKGRIIDAETKEGLVGASVIIKGADGKIKKFSSSKADGDFSITVTSEESCRLDVTMIGFEKHSIPLDSGLNYISTVGTWDGMMNGLWHKNKDDYYVQVGWSNSKWNVSALLLDIGRWNWRSTNKVMHSEFYSTDETLINGNSHVNGNSHALMKITVTYTFGFGKKVSHANKPQISGSASSGILK